MQCTIQYVHTVFLFLFTVYHIVHSFHITHSIFIISHRQQFAYLSTCVIFNIFPAYSFKHHTWYIYFKIHIISISIVQKSHNHIFSTYSTYKHIKTVLLTNLWQVDNLLLLSLLTTCFSGSYQTQCNQSPILMIFLVLDAYRMQA